MTELTDRELRSRFDAIRSADEQGAPSVKEILDRAASAPTVAATHARLWRLRTALATAAAILVAAGLVRVFHHPDFIAPPLATWTSPTASLLRTSGSNLLASPTLLPSMVDKLSASPSRRRKRIRL